MANYSFSQTKIWELTFETPGGYTSTGTESNDGSNDYYGRFSDADVSPNFSNTQGTFFFAVQDKDAAPIPLSSNQQITVPNIDISNYENLEIRIHLARGYSGTGTWDSTDALHVGGNIDGGTNQNLIWVESIGTFNTGAAIDTDFNGTGDGTALTPAFEQFTQAITGTGSDFNLIIDVIMLNSASEDIAFDSIEIWGDFVSTTTTVEFTSTTSTVSEGGMSIDVCASITNEDATNATTVEIALDGSSTATNGIDYDDGASSPAAISFPQTVTFPAGSTSDQCFTIHISNDDLVYEGNETVILNLQNASGGNAVALGTNIQHTLTISDNETPPTADIVITEIMYNSTSFDDEWIEVCNTSGSTQDISNYIIDIGGTTAFIFPASTTISDGNCITISLGSNGDGSYNPGCNFTPDYGIDASTNNTNNLINSSPETITIYTSDGTTVADTVSYTNADGANGNGSSLHLTDTTLDNSNTNTNWTEVSTGGSPGTNSLVSPCAAALVYEIDAYDGQTVYTCNGTFTDSRPTADYFNNENYTVTFCSGSADEILQFIFNPSDSDGSSESNFEIVAGDVLYMYDGMDTSGTLLATITDTSDPGASHFYLYGISECVTFQFISDSSGDDNGWEALISCVPLGCGTNPAAADNFANAPYICDLDGFCGTTIGYTEDLPANLTDLGGSCPGPLFGGTIENNSWIQFVAASTSITLQYNVPTCYGAFGAETPTLSQGIQSAIFEYDGANFTRVSDCAISDGTNNGTFNLTSSSLTVGNTYYIMTDGSAGSQCDYEITIIDGGTGSGATLFSAGADQTSCSGDSVTLTATGPATATYSWTSTEAGFGTVVGNPISVSPTSTATYTVEVTSGACVNETDDVLVTVNFCGAEIMLTQYYEGANDNKWIEVKNISSSTIAGNTYYIVVLNNADADNPAAADPTNGAGSSFNNNILISTDMAPGEVRRYRHRNAILPAYASPGETGYDGNPTFDFGATADLFSGDDIVLISTTNDSDTWANRVDVIGDGTLWGDRRCFVRNECVTSGPSRTFDINEWVEFTDTEVEFSISGTNPYLGEHERGSTEWNGSTWSSGTPDRSREVTLTSGYDTSVNGNLEVCSLTINSGVTLTVTSGNHVEIVNNLTVEDTAIMNINDDASLVMIDDSGIVTLNGTGIINVEKTTTPFEQYDYTYWSSPITNATIGGILGSWTTSRIYSFTTANFSDLDADEFDDDGNDWTSVATGASMNLGVGYAAMGPVGGSFPRTESVMFSGEVNNGQIMTSVSLSANGADANDDWNLIGNPYPSAISIDDFMTLNTNLNGTIYLWTHIDDISISNPGPDTFNFSTNDYAMYNATGGTGTASVSGSSVPTGFVASGQGFFVEAITAGTVEFNNSMRSIGYANNLFYRPSTPETNTETAIEKDRLWLNLTNTDGAFSQILIGFFENATLGNDRLYDGIRFSGSNYINFYSFQDGKKYGIQGRPTFLDSDIVPLGYDANLLGELSIGLSQTEGVLTTSEVYLKDNELNIIHDLRISNYTFTTGEGKFPNRFELLFSSEILSVDEVTAINEEDIFVYIQDNKLIINSRSRIDLTGVSLYSMLGKRVINKPLNTKHSSITLESLKTGIYIVRIQTKNGNAIKKVIKE